ncbi:MAG: leucine-rich repeat domain-containing protein [Clostridia bacterium]|nr:leucine-rich repeat domain-containing protein [Clostridia bacterium]MBR4328681.1 leucine-rich repeat domain-containing protein [Candidatus Riflebacteria bacterium]
MGIIKKIKDKIKPTDEQGRPIEKIVDRENGLIYHVVEREFYDAQGKLKKGKSLIKVEDNSREKKALIAKIPDGVIYIDEGVFCNNQGIVKVEVPASVCGIGEQAFYECKELRQVEIEKGSNLDVIGKDAFCFSKIESIVLPSSLRYINGGAFVACRNLKQVEIEEGSQLKKIDERAFAGSGIEKIKLPASLEDLGKSAFRSCKDLKQVEIEEGSQLKKIDKMAFAESGIEKIKLPASLEYVRSCAFALCERLEQVVLEGTTTTIARDAFYKCESLPKTDGRRFIETAEGRGISLPKDEEITNEAPKFDWGGSRDY